MNDTPLGDNLSQRKEGHPVDLEALSFTRSWFQHRVFADAVWHSGINLAEMNEYDIFLNVLRVLFDDHVKSEDT